MIKTYLCITTVALFSYSAATTASAHCQVPCGIYTDDTVITDLHTHQATIAKAMKEIRALSKDAGANVNQITRWVTNKESHANKIQNTMLDYFLAQRLKLSEMESNKDAYLKKLTLSHKIIVLAMKCKQTTDPENANKLQAAITEFTTTYTAKK